MASWVPPPLPPRWSGTRPAFVGRRRERAVLDEAAAAAAGGERRVVLVGGEPGAGKSRLVAEVATALHGQGAAVLVGACAEDLAAPYEPFVEPLDAMLRALTGDDSALAVTTDDVPVLVDRLHALLGRGRQRQSCPAQRYRRDLYDAAAQALVAACRQTPVVLVLVLEDLHLAGSATLQLLGHVVERTAGSRLLVVGTHRSTLADRSRALLRAASALYRLDAVRGIELAGLDADDVSVYLEREGRLSAARARAAGAALHAATGGNPFFLRELVRDLSAAGDLDSALSTPLRAPASVLDTLASRLEAMAPSERSVLEVAAVVGAEVDIATVAAAARCRPEQTLAAVDSAVGLGLLTSLPGEVGRFRFLHSLARQAVLTLLPPSRQVALHADVAAVLHERTPQTPELVQRLAHHYAQAHALGHADRAVHYLELAARLAEDALAHGEAAMSRERAAGLCEDAERRDRLLLAAANSHVLAATFVRAEQLYDDLASRGTVHLRVHAAIGLERTCWYGGRATARAADVLETELRRLRPDPGDPTYVRCLAGLGRALVYSGRRDDGERRCRDALRLARDLRDDDLLADTLVASMGHRFSPNSLRTTRAHALELTELAVRNGSAWQLASAAYNRTLLAYVQGDRATMDEAHAELGEAARLTGQVTWLYSAGVIAFAQQLVAGSLASARRTCEEMLAVADADGWQVEGPYGVQMYMVRRETGALEQARAVVTGNEDPAQHWAPGLLGIYTELRMPTPTARVVRWLLDGATMADRGSAQWPGVLALLAEAVVWLEDAASARRLRPLLAEYGGLNLVLGAMDGPFGSADRYLAALGSLLGSADVEDLYASALAMDTGMRAPLHQAATLTLHLEHLRRRGETGSRVRQLREQALEIAEPLGLVRVLRALGAAGGQEVPGPAASRRDGLTAREVDVLALLAEGLSNQEIAGRLRISDNTAANHVRSILAKTGSRNRTQAALYGQALG